MLKFVKKLRNIYEGFYYTRVENPVVEEVALQRSRICAECPHAVKGKIFGWNKDERIVEVDGLSCEICKCGISEKIRASAEVCPKLKW